VRYSAVFQLGSKCRNRTLQRGPLTNKATKIKNSGGTRAAVISRKRRAMSSTVLERPDFNSGFPSVNPSELRI